MRRETAGGTPGTARKVLIIAARSLLVLLVTVALLVAVLYGVMYVLARGPSPTAQSLFVRSVRETSAAGFLANIYFSEEEIAEIENVDQVVEFQQMDTSLISMNATEQKTDGPVTDAWGFVDEDGDGIIVDPVRGEGYTGYMMIVLDPSRVIVGCVPEYFGGQGYTVAEMVAEFDAVAGINAGSFSDPDGQGNGSIPEGVVVYEGVVYNGERGSRDGFVGLDSNNIMHVGDFTEQQLKDLDIQYGCCFGPVLLANGEIVLAEDNLGGLNPRTAIGQRSDGAILMLVVDGRQVASIGANYWDLAEIFLEYGGVNACNLDGGSSTLMWYEGDYINNCASAIGIRPVPTTFLVLKEGINTDE